MVPEAPLWRGLLLCVQDVRTPAPHGGSYDTSHRRISFGWLAKTVSFGSKTGVMLPKLSLDTRWGLPMVDQTDNRISRCPFRPMTGLGFGRGREKSPMIFFFRLRVLKIAEHMGSALFNGESGCIQDLVPKLLGLIMQVPAPTPHLLIYQLGMSSLNEPFVAASI